MALNRRVRRLLEEAGPPQGGQRGPPLGVLVGLDQTRESPLGRSAARDVGEDLQRRPGLALPELSTAPRNSTSSSRPRAVRVTPAGSSVSGRHEAVGVRGVGDVVVAHRPVPAEDVRRERHEHRGGGDERNHSDRAGGRPEPFARPFMWPSLSRPTPNRSLGQEEQEPGAQRRATGTTDQREVLLTLVFRGAPGGRGVRPRRPPHEEAPRLLCREERDDPQVSQLRWSPVILQERRGVEARVVEVAQEQDRERRVALPLDDRPRLGKARRDLRAAAERERPGALLALLRCGRTSERRRPKPGRWNRRAAPRRSAGSGGAPRSACPAGASRTPCRRRRRGRFDPPSRPSTGSPAGRAVPSAGRRSTRGRGRRRRRCPSRSSSSAAPSGRARTQTPRRAARRRARRGRAARGASGAARAGARRPPTSAGGDPEAAERAHAAAPAPVTSVTRWAKPATSSPVAGPGAHASARASPASPS